jgi:uncharacterized protein YciI
MFIVFLKFAENKSQASQFMDGHKKWISRGFDEGIFLMAGSLQPQQGGCIIADNTSLSELQDFVSNDPFVVENVVSPEIFEVHPSKVDEKRIKGLSF